ncbi:MAG TPA: hypothetical protein VM490_11390 [Armatimonadaceae bacterium]|nr:hypothetical protein [Armatimonadaceae bacterium]
MAKEFPAARRRAPLAVAAVLLLAMIGLSPAARAQTTALPPEKLPPVTVRWEDAAQREVFVVEGARYRCRVATHPARLLALEVDGRNLLGPGGASLVATDAEGRRYAVPPRAYVPNWDVWRREWTPARSSRARMNVWNASPYYWDAHLLEVPLVREDSLKVVSATPGRALADFDFAAKGAFGWQAAMDAAVARDPEGGHLTVRVSGADPQIQSPPIDLKTAASLDVVLRMRTRENGGAVLYWADRSGGYAAERRAEFAVEPDGAWHEYRVPLPAGATVVRRLRLDPPGTSGTADVAFVRVEEVAKRSGEPVPMLRGELVFHAHPDQLRIEFRAVTPPGGSQVAVETLALEGKGLPAAAAMPRGDGRRPLLTGPGFGLLGAAGGKFAAGVWSAPLAGSGSSGPVWVLRPLAAGETAASAFADDIAPLPASAVTVKGGRWLGYDTASGLYRMRADLEPGAFGFEAAYANPDRRITAEVRVRPDGGRVRRMTVVSHTPVGNLEAAVLTDPHGFPLPETAFVCKNFAGEREEPDDTAYGDAYFPLTLKAGEKETRDFRVVHLTQNWGRLPLKQVSSIRFFNIYWHLSTGASETTCYTHDWMEIGRSQVLHIPDFRPLSGPFWPGQPQHDCFQWPGFLQYNDREGRLVYERTEFEAVSPSLARFTMRYHTSDDAAKAALTVTEMPQRDEMRTFVTLRYDWVKPVAIRGDARAQFRWLNVFEKDTPAALHWLDADGKPRSAAVKTDDAPTVLGEVLTGESPFVESRAAKPGGYHCAVLVRSFRARLGGKTYDRPALSARFGAQDGSWWLTVSAASLQLQPGDFVEADVVLMPHGEAVPPGFKAARERAERFGAGVPRVTATLGEKLSNFPARVRAEDEAAAVVLEGGFDLMTLTAEGFRERGVPLLWRDGVWQDVQGPAGGDGYQVEPDGRGGYRFTFAYPIRHGQKIPLLVTRAACSAGIAALRDENGALAIDAAGTSGGTFTLQSPVLFAPGDNRLAAGSPVVRFTGRAKTVRQAAVRAEAKGGAATVAVEADGRSVRVSGGAPATLTFLRLPPGASVAVEINGNTEMRTVAADGTLRVEATGESSVRVRIAAAAGTRSAAR